MEGVSPIPLVLSAVLVCLLTYVLWKFATRPKNLPPGPKGWPLFGCVGLFYSDIHREFADLGKKYGDVTSMYMLNRLVVVLNGPKSIREAFITKGHDFSGRPNSLAMQLVGMPDRFVTVSYSPDWATEKKFYLTSLRNYGYGTNKIAEKVDQEIKVLVQAFHETGGQPFPCKDLLTMTLVNIIAVILFNERYDLHDPKIVGVNGFARLLGTFLERMTSLFLVDICPLLLPLHLTKAFALRATCTKIKQFLNERVVKHRESFDPNDLRDFTDSCIKYVDSEPDQDVTVSRLFHLCPDSMETMPSALGRMIFQLAIKPDVQRKIQAEIDDVIMLRAPLMSDKGDMPFTEATIMESLRLGNPVPITVPHLVTSDTTLQGFTIPKNSLVFANIFGVHMDSAIWNEPEKFRPERFLDGKGQVTRPSAYMPFSVGHRVCIGEQLALKELFLILTNILQHFTLSLPQGEATSQQLLFPQKYLISSVMEDFQVIAIPRGNAAS